MIIKLILAFAASFALTVLIGRILVPKLRAMKAGQHILEIGPNWHKSKEGTPTMGGLMFIIAIFIVTIIYTIGEIIKGEWSHVFSMLLALLYGGIGFLDDYEKLKKKQNLGLTAKQKLVLQLVVAIVFVLALRLTGNLTTNLYIPFFNVTFPIPEWLYFVLAAFIIVGCVNAVNLTDGVDGLATGVSMPVMLFYVVVAALLGYVTLGVFAAAVLGGLAGFLVFNFHPAKVFMGDTGSLFLGGVVCALAFALDIPLVLVTLGIVYICETLSDIIQVLYFKLTHGKRFFKMAPLHHHFEMCGWNEYKVFAVFTAVSLIFAIISYFGIAGKIIIPCRSFIGF